MEWKEKLYQMRKIQEQLEDCRIKIDAKMSENNKRMKEKEE